MQLNYIANSELQLNYIANSKLQLIANYHAPTSQATQQVVVSDVVCAEWSVFRHFCDWIPHMRRCFVKHCSCMMRGAVVAISSLLRGAGSWQFAFSKEAVRHLRQGFPATSACTCTACREYRSAFWRVAPPVHHVCPLLCV